MKNTVENIWNIMINSLWLASQFSYVLYVILPKISLKCETFQFLNINKGCTEDEVCIFLD